MCKLSDTYLLAGVCFMDQWPQCATSFVLLKWSLAFSGAEIRFRRRMMPFSLARKENICVFSRRNIHCHYPLYQDIHWHCHYLLHFLCATCFVLLKWSLAFSAGRGYVFEGEWGLLVREKKIFAYFHVGIIHCATILCDKYTWTLPLSFAILRNSSKMCWTCHESLLLF